MTERQKELLRVLKYEFEKDNTRYVSKEELQQSCFDENDMYYYIDKLAVKGRGATYDEVWGFTIKVYNGVVEQVDLRLTTLESKKMYAEFQKNLLKI